MMTTATALLLSSVLTAGTSLATGAMNKPEEPKPLSLETPEQSADEAEVDLESEAAKEDADKRKASKKNRLRVGLAGSSTKPVGTGLSVG